MKIDFEGDAAELGRELEWLETDGLGGFASGTVSGIRTRRYHGVLDVAQTPPTGRVMLVNGFEVEVDLGQGPRALSSHLYLPGVVHPDGVERLVAFRHAPFPAWTFKLEGGVLVEQSLAVLRDLPAVVVRWTLRRPVPGARLRVRPLLSVRDVHDLQREREDFHLDAEVHGSRVSWTPIAGRPRIVVHADAVYRHEPYWYKSFLYEEEKARGYGSSEDLASPGVFEFDLGDGDASVVLVAEAAGLPVLDVGSGPVAARARELLEAERGRRAKLPSPLDRAAEAYLVRRGEGLTVIAGYPWFTDWGRDAFISLRGLSLARGRLAEAGSILSAWSELVSEGMLPNRFVDAGEEPEYNSVDASLWYVVAVGEYLEACESAGRAVPSDERGRLEAAVTAILEGYSRGTRFGIRMDADRLLAAGEPGWQLTWMDARVDGEVVTPRIGKPVEVQALWANALHVGARFDGRWGRLRDRVLAAFEPRFWDETKGYLRDVVDVGHVPGALDDTLRPNQVLAVGGLPLSLVRGARARRIVDVLEARLVTPLGLRTLPEDHPAYRGRYAGDPGARDHAYHQGTVWPWLLGPFVEAWVNIRGGSAGAREEARERFLAPLRAHLSAAGLGHVSEIADGGFPHAPRGCPFQAWSLGEMLRLERSVLAPVSEEKRARSPRRIAARRA